MGPWPAMKRRLPERRAGAYVATGTGGAGRVVRRVWSVDSAVIGLRQSADRLSLFPRGDCDHRQAFDLAMQARVASQNPARRVFGVGSDQEVGHDVGSPRDSFLALDARERLPCSACG